MKLVKVIRLLRDFSRNNLIVVEGLNDKRVLKELGIVNIKTLYEIRTGDIRKYDKVLILTDNDKKGKTYYKYIREYFYSEGILDNYQLRKIFFGSFKIRKVEDLKNKIEKIKYYSEYIENGPTL